MNESPVVVRTMTGADLAAANAIGQAHDPAWRLRSDDAGGIRLSDDARPGAIAYVSTVKGAVTGWVFGAFRPADSGYVAFDRLVVTPEHRGRGHARALVAQVLAEYPDTEVLVAAWDRELEAFYTGLGFCVVDEGANMSSCPPHKAAGCPGSPTTDRDT